MAIQLITTLGGSDSNSYVSLDEADLFFTKRLNNGKWVSADEEVKKQALILATEVIDSLPFTGSKVSNTSVGDSEFQRLEWPREPEYSDPYMLGIAHLREETDASRKWKNSDGVCIIPEELKSAVCEEALFLITAIKGIDKRDALRGQGMNSISYPNISEHFEDKKPLAPASIRYLSKLNCIKDGLRISRR